jgi:hypothetical protein
MLNEKEIPKEDIVDEAFLQIVHETLGENLPEEDLDGALDVLFQIIEEFIEEDGMAEIPENEERDSEKQQWLNENLEKIREKFKSSVFLETPEGASESD